MKAIRTFLPSAISPFCVEGPSAITSFAFTISPFLTIGFWLIHVPPFVLLNLRNLYVSNPVFVLMMISSPVTLCTTPPFLATTVVPESLAALYSIPVPTIGESVIIRGTA